MANGRRKPVEHTMPVGIVKAIQNNIPGKPKIAFVIAVEYDGQPHVFGYKGSGSGSGGVPTTINSVYSCTLLSGTGSHVCVWYVDSSGNWRKRCLPG